MLRASRVEVRQPSIGHKSPPRRPSCALRVQRAGHRSWHRHRLYGSRPNGGRATAAAQEYLPREEAEGIGHIAQLALPALVVVLSDPLQTLVDSAVLGRYSTLHLAAIGPNTALFNSIFQLFAFLGVTVANTVSGTMSTGRTGVKARRTFRTAVVLGVGFGAMAIVTIHGCSRAILGYMETAEEVVPFALEYMHVRAFGSPIVLVMNAFQGLCLGQQDTRLPMIVCAAVTGINVVLDLFLVAVKGQGAHGAAVATVVAQMCGLVLMVYLVKRKQHAQGGIDYTGVDVIGRRGSLSLGSLALVYGSVLRNFGTMAIILIARTSAGILAYLAMSTEAMRLGVIAAASHQIAMQLFWFLSYLPEPLSMAAQVKMAKDTVSNPARASRTKRLIVTLGCVIGLVLAAATVGSFTLLPPLFTTEQSIIAQVRALRPLGALAIAICSVLMVYDGMSIGSQNLVHLPIGVGAGLGVVLLALRTADPSAILGGLFVPGDPLASVWVALVGFYATRLGVHLLYYAWRE